MRLQELMRFRRTREGRVPMEVLNLLGLPMPNDVLEQFIFDHGIKCEFQSQYKALDLHAIRWQRLALPASEILSCSIYQDFQDLVSNMADLARAVKENGWANLSILPDAICHWEQHSTWMRAPIMLKGSLVNSSLPFHLVEGHTRTGVLRGLVKSGMLAKLSVHQVWVGEDIQPAGQDEHWREILQTERIPFLDWLMARVGDAGEIGDVASRLIKIQHSSMRQGRIEGDNLDAIVTFARTDAKLQLMIDTISKAHTEWEMFVSD